TIHRTGLAGYSCANAGRDATKPARTIAASDVRRAIRITSRRIDCKLPSARRRPPVGQHVDERRLPRACDLRRALQCRPYVGRLLDELAVTAERFGHLVEAGVSEIAPRPRLLRVAAPAAVQADDDDHADLV